MSNKMKNTATSAALGLNAAAVIWLYTHFVPRSEYEKTYQQVQELRTQEMVLHAKVAVLQSALYPAGNPFE